MPKRNATTAHGDIQYETVVCTSCENEVPEPDAHRVVIGDVQSTRRYGALGYTRYEVLD